MRAREPDYEGTVERDGVRVGYDVYGAGDRAPEGWDIVINAGPRRAVAP